MPHAAWARDGLLAELLLTLTPRGPRSDICHGCLPGLVAVALFVPLVPLTHGLGGRLLFGKSSWSPKSTFLRGGSGFLALQTLSWTTWALAVVAAVAGVAAAHRASLHAHTPVLSGAAVCGSLLAEVLTVASLLTFQEASPPADAPHAPPAEDPGPGGGDATAPHRRTQSDVVLATFAWWTDDDNGDGDGDGDSSPTVCGSAAPAATGGSPMKQHQGRGHRRHASASARTTGGPAAEASASASASASAPPPRRGAPAPPGAGGRWLERLDARGTSGAAAIVVLSLVLSLMGHSLMASVALDAVAGAGRLVFVAIAAVSAAVASPVTHGLGGRLHHGEAAGWRHWQPGLGGRLFVACQALGWALYSVSVLAFAASCWLLTGTLTGRGGVAHPRWVLPAAFWGAGASGLAAQVTLALSLLAFRPAAAKAKLGTTAAGPAAVVAAAAAAVASSARSPPKAVPRTWRDVAQGVQLHATMMAVLLLVYAPQHLVLSVLASLFLVMPPHVAAAVLCVAGCGYGTTYLGQPAVTGRRTWDAFRLASRHTLCAALIHWFGGIRVVAAAPHPMHDPGHGHGHGGGGAAASAAATGGEDGGDRPGDADADGSSTTRRPPFVVFGYHPHGLYPAAAAWFHLTGEWQAAFPQHRGLVTLGASAIFATPLLRDVVMWSGARVVSRASVARALLHERRSVCLCPGGQAELVLHECGPATVLATRHRGFLRAALEAGAGVCPIFVFGEAHTQRNLLRWRRMQRWTTKHLGFPIPSVPGGYLRVLPLPEPVPLTFVVGPCLWPHDVGLGQPRQQQQQVTPQHVEALHAKYYAALADIFERHKAEAGFPDATLVLKDE